MLAGAVAAGDDLLMSASALAESLVGPSRRGSFAVERVIEVLEAVPIDVVPVDRAVATAAAQLRADHRRLRLPDALVIATAIAVDADRLVTTDRRWPTAEELGLAAELIHP